jgi:hypothetical protein
VDGDTEEAPFWQIELVKLVLAIHGDEEREHQDNERCPCYPRAFPVLFAGFFAMNSPCFFTMLPSTLASTPASFILNRFLPSVSDPIKINKSRDGFYAWVLDFGWKMTYTVDM